MRVLYFVKQFAAPTLTFIYNEIVNLSKHAEVFIITTNRINEELFPISNIKIIRYYESRIRKKILHTFQSNDYLFSFKNKEFKKAINKYIKELRPDIIHTHFGFESWWFLANLNKTSIPVFISLHGFDASHKLKSNKYINLLKYFISRNNLIPIFASKFMASNIENYVGYLSNKHILYYGTNIEFFKRINYKSKKTEIKFLQISSFSEKKGHEYTIKAFKILLINNPSLNIKLILAGEGDLKLKMIQLSKDLNLSDKIEFPGLVNSFEAKELMETSNVFLHHSITSKKGDMEGIPNAIMEAMAMEMPILSTFHSGIPELVENNVNGLLSVEKNIDTYAEHMFEILKWNYLEINRKKIKNHFEILSHSYQLYEFYKKSIAKILL
ncbi:MAG TPA: glycosyltransferase [Saprospiraceae bacterium]|nr:glycosyltransferase [Saprospiraceae bacterium]